MSVFARIGARMQSLIGKTKVMIGAATGLAMTYGAYKVVLGGTPIYKSALTEGSAKKNRAPPVASQTPPLDTDQLRGNEEQPKPDNFVSLDPAALARSQPCVISPDKAHALFLWIRVKDTADFEAVACRVARLQQHVQETEASCETYSGTAPKILAGVGFGPEFYQQIKGGTPQPVSNAKHTLISSNSVGGDILVHAKCNNQEALQQLSKAVLNDLPEGSVLWSEEVCGYHTDPVRISKKQSGFESLGIVNYQYSMGEMDLWPKTAAAGGPGNDKKDKEKDKKKEKKKGEKKKDGGDQDTEENRPLMFVSNSGSNDTEKIRRESAVDPETGGSYVMTQQWLHDVKMREDTGEAVFNEWVDRAWNECSGSPGERSKFRTALSMGTELANFSMDQWMGQAYQDCLKIQQKHPEKQIMCSPGAPSAKPFNVLRQSLPYKEKGGGSGLFFICYASSPAHNDLLLDRLVASACHGGRLSQACQNVFRLSRNMRSASWYFPGLKELEELECQ